MMIIKLSIFSIFVIFYAGVMFFQNCGSTAPANNTSSNNGQTESISKCPKATEPFPSYSADKLIKQNYSPPEWYCEEYGDTAKRKDFPIFQLNQNYGDIPAFFGECGPEDCPWLKFDYKTESQKYLEEVLRNAYQGNLENDWTNPKDWYGAPFMHLDTVSTFQTVDPVGREFMRGLTQERAACSRALDYRRETDKEICPAICTCSSTTDDCYESWAISFYNKRGASYINKVWTEVQKKENRNLEVLNEGFPDGTVAVKFLFTEAAPDVFRQNSPRGREIDYLNESVEWQADIRRVTKNGKTRDDCLENNLPAEKCFPKLRLVQIDVAVKDKRMENGKFKSPTSWVFGTFIFNKDAKPIFEYKFPGGLSEAEKTKINAWLKLEWVGVMWGNDPTKLKGQEIVESKNNENISEKQHYGCGADKPTAKLNRLSGPIDSPVSSCLSCHALSETPKNLNPDSVPYAVPSNVTDRKGMSCKDKDGADIKYWFRNINPHIADHNRTFSNPSETYTLDYSLQLREGIFRYWLKENRCFESEELLKACFGIVNETNKSNSPPKEDVIKSILNRGGLQRVEK